MKTQNNDLDQNIINTTTSQFVTKDIDYMAEEGYRDTENDDTVDVVIDETEDILAPDEMEAVDVIIDADAKVDITNVESMYGLDGELVDRIEGTVDGHAAQFIANEEGQVIMAGIDNNDDGQISLDEVADLSDENISELDLVVRDNVGESIVPVEIEDIDIVMTEDDELAYRVSAQIAGHEAVVIEDGNGNIVHGQIDLNDDGVIERDETFDLEAGQLTVDQFIALDTVPEEEENPLVITAIESTQNAEGETVDLVCANVEGHEAFFVDDTEGNLVFAGVDSNDNGTFEIDEIVNLADTGTTVDDLIAAADFDMPDDVDYSAMA